MRIYILNEEKSIQISGLSWRIGWSIIWAIGWLIFLIIWLFFIATEYSIYENIGIFIISILIIGYPWCTLDDLGFTVSNR